jgi:hypothetical protein
LCIFFNQEFLSLYSSLKKYIKLVFNISLKLKVFTIKCYEMSFYVIIISLINSLLSLSSKLKFNFCAKKVMSFKNCVGLKEKTH